ncbi:MAG: hypothetical protein ABW007_18955 [Chitinophagaceae bacterium]
MKDKYDKGYTQRDARPCVYILKERRKDKKNPEILTYRYHVYTTDDLEHRRYLHSIHVRMPVACKPKGASAVKTVRGFVSFEIPWVLYTESLRQAEQFAEVINQTTPQVRRAIVAGNKALANAAPWVERKEKQDRQ